MNYYNIQIDIYNQISDKSLSPRIWKVNKSFAVNTTGTYS